MANSLKKIVHALSKVVIYHSVFENIEEMVLSQVAYNTRGKLIMVIGPTGAGKTTLIRSLNNKLEKWVEENPDEGFGSPVVLEAYEPENGEFSWKNFYWASLYSPLEEPGMKRKLNIDRAVEDLRQGKKPFSYRTLTVFELRDLLQEVIEVKKPIAIFIDEVQALAKAKKQVRRGDNFDVLKSLSNDVKVPIITVGTYEARKMLYASGQGARRVSLAHMHRYKLSDIDGEFTDIVNMFCDDFGLPLSVEARQNIDYLYDHTLGCVGILSDWFSNAAKMAIERKSRVISHHLLDETRLENIQLATIGREIHAFESEHSSEGDFDSLAFFKSLDCANDDHYSKKPVTKKNKVRRKPGVRKPHRDRVGNAR